MKLELKHLSAYLPYGLEMIFQDPKGRITKMRGICDYAEKGITVSTGHGGIWIEDSGMKPILRPLSDLEKHIDLGGLKLIALEELQVMYNTINETQLTKLNFYYTEEDGFCLFGIADEFENEKEIAMPLYMYENMFRWHFDVYNLIESGLAIDINTLDK